MESRWNPAARRGATCRFVTVSGEQVQWQAWVCLKVGMYHKISPNNTVGFNGEHDNKPWFWVAYFETTPCIIPIIQSFKENMNLSDTAVHDIPYRTLCFVWFCEVVLEQFRYIARLFDHAQFNVLSGYRVSLALLQNIRQVELKHFLIQDENMKSLKPPSNRSDRTLVGGWWFPWKNSVEIIIPGRMQNSRNIISYHRQPMISEIKISIIIKILNILISLSIYLLMISSYYFSK